MKQIKQTKHNKLFTLLLILFVLFYPMLISIYVFLPLFIGTMSYMLLEGLERDKPLYIVLSVGYLMMLEVNLSLPLFLTLLSVSVFYVMFYRSLCYFRHCHICKPVISVVVIDFFYLLSLMLFDFIFQTHSINLDTMLLYSLVVDMLVVMVL